MCPLQNSNFKLLNENNKNCTIATFEATKINFFVAPARGCDSCTKEINWTSIFLFLAARNKSFFVYVHVSNYMFLNCISYSPSVSIFYKYNFLPNALIIRILEEVQLSNEQPKNGHNKMNIAARNDIFFMYIPDM